MSQDTVRQQDAAPVPRHFSQLVDPRAYAEYSRRAFAAPTWDTFDNQLQFMTLRAFSRDETGALVRWREDLDLYTEKLKLGRWMWLIYGTVIATNFWELIAEMKERNLFLFDIWGHVPGSEINNGMVGHVMPPPGMVDRLKQEMGANFLGFDNGEQDGRFVWGYANQQCPVPRRRIDVYQNFCHHFDRMTSELGANLTLLVSLTFPHYLAKNGGHMLLGAESAQALPCSQVVYNFVRGAGKQYGLLWFGNASVYNRWSCKSYEDTGAMVGDNAPSLLAFGPTKGTSLSLLKRMMYAHIFYNCAAVGMENGWLVGDNTEKRIAGLPVRMDSDPSTAVLSPVGTIQAEAVKFAEQHGEPGVMHAPVALLLDFAAGWTVPRHLYTDRIYEVWGSHPYEEGDYLTHLIVSLLYPHYEDASYYHDERGFMCETPFGDMTDALLTDVPSHILGQYSLVVCAGTIRQSEEIKDKLRNYVSDGGRLLLTRENADWCWPEIQPAKAGEVAELKFGEGTVIVGPTATGVVPAPSTPDVYINECDKPLACPYELERVFAERLQEELRAQQIFAVGENLGLVTCRRSEGGYRILVYNNSFEQQPLNIECLNGRIQSYAELHIDRSERNEVGYWPEGFEDADGGENSPIAIAGGDLRVFDITIEEERLSLVEPSPLASSGAELLLRLRASSLEEAYRGFLARPTFFDHYSGIVLGWRCLLGVDPQILQDHKGIFDRLGLKLVIDFSESLNYYPDLVLIDTLSAPHEETMRKMGVVLGNCSALGVKDVLFSLHRKPEERCNDERAATLFRAALRKLSALADEHGLSLHLQPHPEKWLANYADTVAFLGQEALKNIRPAYNLCHALMLKETTGEADISNAKFVLLSLPSVDRFGQVIDAHAPLHTGTEPVALPTIEGKTLILDAAYETTDEEYKDVRFLHLSGL